MTYLEELTGRYNAQTHHSFLLHGATRDLQLGSNGSCSLVDHLVEALSALERLVVVYRVGTGWKFAAESDKREFAELVGLGAGSAGDFAGLVGSDSGDDLPLDPAGAIGLFDVAMRQTSRAVVMVVDRAEFVCPNSPYDRLSPSDKAILSMLQAIASDRSVESTRNIIALVTDSLVDVAESLRLSSSRYYAIEIATPDFDERLGIADQVFPQLSEAGVVIELLPREFAQATSMLSRYGLMDILLDARQELILSKDQVKRVKQKVMSQEYGDILEILDPVVAGYRGVAGLEPLKAFFATIVSDMIAGRLGDVPAGMLLAGAAGLGKSYFMRAVAGESGLPVINLNIGRILGSYVGQSERNLERALAAIRGAAPCIVCLDEIETTFPDRSSAAPAGDSGVSSRILKRMLEELSDPRNRGRVCWVGITNFPQKLDAALSRAGRFDVTVAFVPPTLREREQLVLLFAGKYDLPAPSAVAVGEIGKLLVGYTNAEIENVSRKARQLWAKAGATTQQAEIDALWVDAIERVRANTRDVDEMTVNALRAVNDSDLLPAEYIERWKLVTGQVKPQQQAAPASGSKRPF